MDDTGLRHSLVHWHYFLKQLAMETKEIATRLAEYCRKKEGWEAAQKALYDKDATSTEPHATPDFEQVTKGLDAIIAKGKKFDSMIETVHKLTISEPLIAGDVFAFVMDLELTMKGKGKMGAPELCVYKVKNGKIISEQFFI